MQRRVSSDGGPHYSKRRYINSLAGSWWSSGITQIQPPPPHAPSLGAGCQELLMNLFSRQPCYLGLWFRVRECTQWDLKPNHLLHSPTPLPDSQPSPFTKQHFLGTLSHRYLPFGMVGLSLTGPAVFVFVYCTSVFVCACATVHLSIRSRGYMCINVCVSVL